MARCKGKKRPYAPGAGQDAGQQKRHQEDPEAEYSFKGRTLQTRAPKREQPKVEAKPSRAPMPKSPKPSTDVAAFTRAAARRGAPAPSAQRDRLVAAGIIKEVANVQ